MTTINDLINRRGITRLCHFTKSNKLPHILSKESGIVANTSLDDQIELLSKNDPLRLDGKEDYVCCTIEYPNTWYLRKIRDRDPLFNQWVILFINPKSLTAESTLFCHRNAAANYGAYIKEGLEGFEGMFKQQVQGQRLMTRSNVMLSCCPTDDQAEVLVYKNIIRSDILGIAVANSEQARLEKSRLNFVGGVPRDIPFFIAPDLFDISWSTMVRMGQRPTETLYREE